MTPPEVERRKRNWGYLALAISGLLAISVLTDALFIGESDTGLFDWLWLKFGP